MKRQYCSSGTLRTVALSLVLCAVALHSGWIFAKVGLSLWEWRSDDEGGLRWDREIPENCPWPLPAKMRLGNETFQVDVEQLQAVNNLGDSEGAHTLEKSFKRFKERTLAHQSKPCESKVACIVLVSINVNNGEITQPKFDLNETYTIKMEEDRVIVTSETVFGAFHALETLSQLIRFNFTNKVFEIANSPWEIIDGPRFSHRELLIDTARHYLPVPVLKHLVTSMTFAKMNTLHWHITDDQSFPFCSERYPRLCQDGAFSDFERYTVEDLQEIVEYSRERGVRVMAELDVPGHTKGICTGYPDVCVDSGKIIAPGTKAGNIIDGLLEEFRDIFPDSMVHLGGDEVRFQLWEEDPGTVKYLEKHNKTSKEAYLEFVLGAHAKARDLGFIGVGWFEILANFASELSSETVIARWIGTNKEVVQNGLRSIDSDQSMWYLDHLGVSFLQAYQHEPCDSLTEAECRLVIGGGGCMWGETVDTSDLDSTVWPRLAAIAERLWSPRELPEDYSRDASLLTRANIFRCNVLHPRRVGAAPILNKQARQAPSSPGGCLELL